MKKLAKIMTLCLALVMCVSLFAGCSKATKQYADKVNQAAEKGEHLTYTQVLKDLGDEAIDVTLLKTGFIYAAKGCKTFDEIQAKIDAGKTVEGITIIITAGKAISASYGVIKPEK